MEISSAVKIENAEVYGITPNQDSETSRTDRNIDFQKLNYGRSVA